MEPWLGCSICRQTQVRFPNPRVSGNLTTMTLHLLKLFKAHPPRLTRRSFYSSADVNKVVIVFPQAIPNFTNPLGCWDWWQYLGDTQGHNFATERGLQMQGVAAMLQQFIKKYEKKRIHIFNSLLPSCKCFVQA